MTSRTKGTGLVLICVALWALIPVVARLGQTSLDHHQFLFWSSLVSFLVLLIPAVINKSITEITRYNAKDWVQLSTLGLLGTYVYYLFLYLGYARTSGVTVLVFQYTWPFVNSVLFGIHS